MRKCCLCCQPQPSGDIQDGMWVCYGCFPEENRDHKQRGKSRPHKGKRKEHIEYVPMACGKCGHKSNSGGFVGNVWVCNDCDLDMVRHKNKYAKFSKVDQEYNWYDQSPRQNTKKKRKKNKQGLFQIEYWKVVITDISDGKL